MNLELLRACFAPEEIEWRIGQCGKNQKGIWAKCLAYISNRAVMERLDDVCGPAGWRNEFAVGPGGGVVCGISIRVTHEDGISEWVTKFDGAGNTDIESVKGGLSDAMKRAAVQWGIGRYLYDLEEGWAVVGEKGEYFGKTKDGDNFRWSPPDLPAWATPSGTAKPQPKAAGNNVTTADTKYIEECAEEIRNAPSVESLAAIGLILKDKSPAIQNALRGLYATRQRVLKTQPEAA